MMACLIVKSGSPLFHELTCKILLFVLEKHFASIKNQTGKEPRIFVLGSGNNLTSCKAFTALMTFEMFLKTSVYALY